MWFKNLLLYRLPADWSLSPLAVEERLAQRPLQPCRGYDMQTSGWVFSSPQQRLVHTLDRHQLIAFGTDQKLLPASVISQVTKERAAQVAVEQGYPVGKRQMRELKERVAEELRARAFTRRTDTLAWIDPERRSLVVDASSPARGEELVQVLRDSLGIAGIHLVETARSPAVSMGAWLMYGEAPGRFEIETDLELQSVKDDKSLVRYVRHPLEGKEVQKHISSGKSPTKLGLSWNARMSFILNAQMQIKRLQFLDIVKDRAEDQAEAADEQFDIDFALMTGLVGPLLDDLVEALGGFAEESLDDGMRKAS